MADGSVRFVLDGAAAVALTSGDHVVIEPGVTHHVEPAADARFAIDFYATKDDEA